MAIIKTTDLDPVERRAIEMFRSCRFHRERPNKCFALKEMLCIDKYRCPFYQRGPVRMGAVPGLKKEKEKENGSDCKQKREAK